MKKRTKRKVTSNDPRIASARQRVNEAFARFEADPTNLNHEHLQQEKSNLKTNYDQAFEDELEVLIAQVEDADTRSEHADSWKVINQISGRK